MNSNDLKILHLFAEKVREHFPAAEVRLFGSRARDDASPESDMDVCVILDKLDRDARDLISHIAWEVGYDNGVVIATIKYEHNDFVNGRRSASPLAKNILQEGVLV